MKNQAKKTYSTPELNQYGSFVEITLQGGPSNAVDGLLGVDLDGNGTVDIPTGSTRGGPIAMDGSM